MRSWPAYFELDADGWQRPHVIDDLPRLEVTDYDLASNPACWKILRDCTLVEWDIALAAEDMHRWERYVDANPAQVHVAAYRVYTGTGYATDDWLPPIVGPSGRFLPGTASPFGFGLIWFPAAVVDRFHEAEHHPHAGWFTDGTFSRWYIGAYGAALVHRDVRPVHLNYQVSVPPL